MTTFFGRWEEGPDGLCCCRTVSAARTNQSTTAIRLLRWLKRHRLTSQRALNNQAINSPRTAYKIRGWRTAVIYLALGFLLGLSSTAVVTAYTEVRLFIGFLLRISFGGHHICVYLKKRGCEVNTSSTLQEKRLGTLDLSASFRIRFSIGYQP